MIGDDTPFFSSFSNVIIYIGVTSDPVPAVVGINTKGNLGPLAFPTTKIFSIFGE